MLMTFYVCELQQTDLHELQTVEIKHKRVSPIFADFNCLQNPKRLLNIGIMLDVHFFPEGPMNFRF